MGDSEWVSLELGLADVRADMFSVCEPSIISWGVGTDLITCWNITWSSQVCSVSRGGRAPWLHPTRTSSSNEGGDNRTQNGLKEAMAAAGDWEATRMNIQRLAVIWSVSCRRRVARPVNCSTAGHKRLHLIHRHVRLTIVVRRKIDLKICTRHRKPDTFVIKYYTRIRWINIKTDFTKMTKCSKICIEQRVAVVTNGKLSSQRFSNGYIVGMECKKGGIYENVVLIVGPRSVRLCHFKHWNLRRLLSDFVILKPPFS